MLSHVWSQASSSLSLSLTSRAQSHTHSCSRVCTQPLSSSHWPKGVCTCSCTIKGMLTFYYMHNCFMFGDILILSHRESTPNICGLCCNG